MTRALKEPGARERSIGDPVAVTATSSAPLGTVRNGDCCLNGRSVITRSAPANTSTFGASRDRCITRTCERLGSIRAVVDPSSCASANTSPPSSCVTYTLASVPPGRSGSAKYRSGAASSLTSTPSVYAPAGRSSGSAAVPKSTSDKMLVDVPSAPSE